VVPYYLFGGITPASKTLQSSKPNSNSVVPVRRRKRRSSSSSALSAGSITPVPSDSVLGLIQSVGATRDFEGVGGWRLGAPSDDDEAWTKINSRLELPADHGRRHRRSLTSGSMPLDGKHRSYSPEAVMNTSRARTPPSTTMVGEYFPQVSSPRALKRTSSVLTGTSGSSGSSKGSSTLSMKQR